MATHSLPVSNTNDASGGDCAQKLKVLADATRLNVLRELMAGRANVTQLSERLDIDQSLLSHHLRVLREHDLVATERDGRTIWYSLSDSARPSKRGKQVEAVDLGCCKLSF